MAPLLILLLLGVVAYFVWRRSTSSLTRDCRWRQNRAAGHWRCAACGAISPGHAEPRSCQKPR